MGRTLVRTKPAHLVNSAPASTSQTLGRETKRERVDQLEKAA